jgi:hypothetical protein
MRNSGAVRDAESASERERKSRDGKDRLGAFQQSCRSSSSVGEEAFQTQAKRPEEVGVFLG